MLRRINFDVVRKIGIKVNIFKSTRTKRYQNFDHRPFSLLHNTLGPKMHFTTNVLSNITSLWYGKKLRVWLREFDNFNKLKYLVIQFLAIELTLFLK